MQSTPFLTWTRISSIASSLLATSRPIEVSGAPIQLGYPVGQALTRRDVTAGRGDARAVEQAGGDGVAHRQADLPGIARGADRGVAGRDDLLGEEHAAQGAELHRLIEIDVLFGLGVAISQMNMHVDQARHDEEGIVVQHRLADRDRRRPRRRADIGEQSVVAVDEGPACRWRRLITGEERATPHVGRHETASAVACREAPS